MGNKSSSTRGSEEVSAASTLTTTINGGSNKNTTTCSAKKSNLPLLISVRDWDQVRLCLHGNMSKKKLKRQAKMNQGASLRRAIERGAPADVVLDLLAVYPKAASMADRQGKLALHYECHEKKVHRHASDYFTSASIRSNASQSSTGSRGRFDDVFPQTSSSLSSCSSEYFSSSIRTTLRSEDHTHNTQVLEALLAAYPQGASMPTNKECGFDVPLHIACRTRPPCLDVIHILLKANPAAASQRNAKQELPLHLAMSACEGLPVSVSLFQTLIQVYPESARLPVVNVKTTPKSSSSSDENEQRPLPLHVACQQGYPVNIVRELLNVYPNAVSQSCSSSNHGGATTTPLHLACQHGSYPSSYIVRVLLDQCPTAASMVNNPHHGMLPIHVLVVEAWRRHSHSHPYQQQHQPQPPLHPSPYHPEGDSEAAADTSIVQTMRVLLEAYPEGAIKTDRRGMLPLHYACMLDGIDEEEAEVVEEAGNSGSNVQRRRRGGMTITTAMVQLIALLLKSSPQSAAIATTATSTTNTSDNKNKNKNNTSGGGDLALHLVCRCMARLNASIHAAKDTNAATHHDSSFRAKDVPQLCHNLQAAAQVLDHLLQVYPHAAAMSDGEGRFPLVLLAEQEWKRREEETMKLWQSNKKNGANDASSSLSSSLASNFSQEEEEVMNTCVKRLVNAYPNGSNNVVFQKKNQKHSNNNHDGGKGGGTLSWSRSFFCKEEGTTTTTRRKTTTPFSSSSSSLSVSIPPPLPVLVE